MSVPPRIADAISLTVAIAAVLGTIVLAATGHGA